jgi:RNA polymerase sigma-70 factor, ECF subfamily
MKSLRFKILVHAHQKWVYTHAFYFLGNRADAEDVCQEVLLRIWRYLDEIKWDSARPWISKTTRNLCLDVLRRRKHRVGVSAEDETILNLPAEGFEADPSATAHNGLMRQQISEALQRLPELQRSMIIMREIQDMSYHQISAALDMPLNTVKVYILRGRQSLRKILAHQLKDELQNV